MVIRLEPVAAGLVPETQPVTGRVTRTDVAEPVQAEPEATAPSAEDIAEVTDSLNDLVKAFNTSLRFEVSEENRLIIRVVDSVTSEVIKEIPPESLIKALKHLEKAMGLLIDQKG